MINNHTSHTFTKSQRLLTANEFGCVFDNPIKKIHSEHLLVFVQVGKTTHARLGLAITKKKLKRAVRRNYVKRLAREHFRLNAPKIGMVDVVLIVKKGHAKDTNLHDELSAIFKRLVMLYPAVIDHDN